jgi:hypothetical protein
MAPSQPKTKLTKKEMPVSRHLMALLALIPSPLQCAVTCVLAVEELLPGFESAFVPLTVAVFLTVLPAVSGLPNFTVNFMVAPFREDNDNGMRVPTLQLTVAPDVHGMVLVEQVSLRLTIEQLTLLADTLTKVVLAGSMSLITTPTADCDPRSPTPIA